VIAVVLLLLASGCAAPGAGPASGGAVSRSEQTQASPLPDQTSLDRLPACPRNRTTRLDTGLTVRYEGADPSDPQTCRLSWLGRTRRFFAGFWGSGRYRHASRPEQQAIRQAVMGPVGTKASFDDTHSELWGMVSVEHVANPVLPLRTGTRRTIEVRIVRHDARGRSAVRAISLCWIDHRTGILLQRQTVTTMANGEQQVSTDWRVQEISDVVS